MEMCAQAIFLKIIETQILKLKYMLFNIILKNHLWMLLEMRINLPHLPKYTKST